MSRLITFLSFAILSVAAHADWQLDDDASSVSFVTVKNGMVAEAHSFTSLSGTVDDSGRATVEVLLGSVDTMIPIRDERMRDMLFKVATFPVATFETDVDLAGVTGLAEGSSTRIQLKGTLSLHGKSGEITAPVSVLRASGDTFVVTSEKSVLVNSTTFGLEAGVEALREVAGLASIAPVAPVNFHLVFRKTRQSPPK